MKPSKADSYRQVGSLVMRHVLVISVLRRWREEDQEPVVILAPQKIQG